MGETRRAWLQLHHRHQRLVRNLLRHLVRRAGVGGVAALAASYNPSASNSQIEQAIESGAVKIGSGVQ